MDLSRASHPFDVGLPATRAVDAGRRVVEQADQPLLLAWARLSLTVVNATHHSGPDETADIIRTAATEVGLHDVGIHLCDLEQRVLRRLDAGTETHAAADEIAIEGTDAGLAYQHEEVRAEALVDGTLLWVPLVDGIERLGVLSAVTAEDTHEHRWLAAQLASLAAMALVTKDQYGDDIARTRRAQPLSIESELRWALLPPLTSTGPGAVVAAAMAPAYRVAGDAYDYAWHRGRLHLALFDAVGHDLHATRVANLALASYRHGRGRDLDLGGMYEAIGDHLRILYGTGDFVTGQLATLDTATGEICWLSAGHPRPFLLRSGRVVAELFCPVSPPFGIGTSAKAVASGRLEPGDHVLFYSDGIVEATLPQGGQVGPEGLSAIVERHLQHGLPAAEMVRRISRDLHGETAQRDDATMVLVRWSGVDAAP